MDLRLAMVVMLITGSANTLLMKWQCKTMAPTGANQPAAVFDHPFVQTFLMMIGELLCLITWVFFIAGNPKEALCRMRRQFPVTVFLIPSFFDWTATTLVNAAYFFIAASVVQMTRGAVVVFTCLFSVLFLGRRQHGFHLTGVGLVVLGITCVAYAAVHGSMGAGTGPLNNPLVGVALCLLAQVFQAGMMVMEEKVLGSYNVEPLVAVGLEGVFGCIIGVVLLAILGPLHVEHTDQAVYQMTHSSTLLIACILSIGSIAFFNWSGITVTQKASCVARSTIDCSRTIVIWMIELMLHWNTFSWSQLGGFVLLAFGTLLYNECVRFPAIFYYPLQEELPMAEDSDICENKPLVSPASSARSTVASGVSHPVQRPMGSFDEWGR